MLIDRGLPYKSTSLRGKNPVRGKVSPDFFVPLIEVLLYIQFVYEFNKFNGPLQKAGSRIATPIKREVAAFPVLLDGSPNRSYELDSPPSRGGPSSTGATIPT